MEDRVTIFLKNLSIEKEQLAKSVIAYLNDNRKIYFFQQRKLWQLVRHCLLQKNQSIGRASILKQIDVTVGFDKTKNVYYARLRAKKGKNILCSNVHNRDGFIDGLTYYYNNATHGPLYQLLVGVNLCFNYSMVEKKDGLILTREKENKLSVSFLSNTKYLFPNMLKKTQVKRKANDELSREKKRLKRSRNRVNRALAGRKRERRNISESEHIAKMAKVNPFANYTGGKTTLLCSVDTPGSAEYAQSVIRDLQPSINSVEVTTCVARLSDGLREALGPIPRRRINKIGDDGELLLTEKLPSGVEYPIGGTNMDEYEDTCMSYPALDDIVYLNKTPWIAGNALIKPNEKFKENGRLTEEYKEFAKSYVAHAATHAQSEKTMNTIPASYLGLLLHKSRS